jgi:hypothetical protein
MMKKNCFVKEKGEKESPFDRAASLAAKKQRNKRRRCAEALCLCRKFLARVPDSPP